MPLPTTPSAPFSTSDWAILLYPEPTQKPELDPPSMLPIPPEKEAQKPTQKDEKDENHYVDFDEKWNVEESPDEDDYPDITPSVEKSMPGTMVLVIGIILGAFIAMILIVIFVLKIRVRVDGHHVKCEEAAPRYQFAPPNDYGELGGEQETATTSLMEGSVAPPPPVMGGVAPGGPAGYNNGMFNNNCGVPALRGPGVPPNLPSSNGANSRLFQKSNGSKPVREWYV